MVIPTIAVMNWTSRRFFGLWLLQRGNYDDELYAMVRGRPGRSTAAR